MAVFTSIPDTDLDANSPITENLMLALRDNPKAIAEGDATAPKIANAAFADNTINASKLINSSITNSKLGSASVSDAKIIKTFSSSGTWTVNQNTTFWMPSGVYVVLAKGSGDVYLSTLGADSMATAGNNIATIISNGANYRVTCGVAENATIYYMKLS